MLERIGFIGLGLMGWRMAATLCKAGFELTVWTRTPGKAEDFARQHDARVAGTPAALAAEVDAVVTMVLDGAAVEEVLCGRDGVAEGARHGLLCLDCSTIGPTWSRRIGETLAERGLALVEAPVSGSLPGAQSGTLTMLVGGTSTDVGRAQPLLDAMGKLIVHVGELGQAQLVKIISNSMGAANLVAVGEALLLASHAGVDLDAFEQVVPGTAGASAMLSQKAGPMRRHDYSTMFKLEQMLKDVRLCLEEAERAGVPFTAAAEARQRLAAAAGRGHGADDYAAVIEALEGTAGERL